MLIYDGDCGFCTRAAQWAHDHLKVRVQPWQSTDLVSLGLTQEQCESAVQWISPTEDSRSGGAAIAEALTHGPRAWPYLGATLSHRAVSPAVSIAYRYVAQHRGTISRLTRSRSLGNKITQNPQGH